MEVKTFFADNFFFIEMCVIMSTFPVTLLRYHGKGDSANSVVILSFLKVSVVLFSTCIIAVYVLN